MIARLIATCLVFLTMSVIFLNNAGTTLACFYVLGEDCVEPNEDPRHNEDYAAYMEHLAERDRQEHQSDCYADVVATYGLEGPVSNEEAAAAARCADIDPPDSEPAQTSGELATTRDPFLSIIPASSLPNCQGIVETEQLAFADLVQRFPGVPDAESQLFALGWQTGIHRQYTCDEVPASGAQWLDISIHRFADATSASAATPLFAYARTVGTQLDLAPATPLGTGAMAISGPSEWGTEYTLYVSSNALLFRVSVIATDVDPRAYAERVAQELSLAIADLSTDTRDVPVYSVDANTERLIVTYPVGIVVQVEPGPD